MASCGPSPGPSGSRLWQNGRFSQNYDRLGPCLGSGGMGSVWAARVGGSPSAPHTTGTGSWVAVKAIPIELTDGERADSLHTGLRECLSTFRDLSPVHVVRYEDYWLEEPAHLPAEMRRLLSERGIGGRPMGRPDANAGAVSNGATLPSLQLPIEGERTLSRSSSAQSLRYADTCGESPRGILSWRYGTDNSLCSNLPFGYGRGCNSWLADNTYASASFADSCGIVFEPATNSSSPPTPASTPLANSKPRNFGKGGIQAAHNTTCVVLLIEMELMGPPPDGQNLATADERFTLRSWLERGGRTFSDAADVFGALVLGVRHIHRKRLVHADLKPDNIFMVVEPPATLPNPGVELPQCE